jgi:hypothetical protein
MTSPLYPIIAKFIEDEWVKLEQNQITPWCFLNAGPPFRCKDFYGKEIAYQGIGFEGSPSVRFWGRYIEPFLEDITERTVQETIRLATEKQQSTNEPLSEVSGLLKSLARRAYDRMAVVEQRLLGKGFPENVARRGVDAEFASMENFINQRIMAEMAMTKRKYWFNEFYNNHPFLFWCLALLVPILIGLVT